MRIIIRRWMRDKKTDRLVPHPFRDWGDQSRCVFPRDKNDYIVLLSSHRAATVIVRVAARQKSTGCSFAEINNEKCPRNSLAFVWRRENFEAGCVRSAFYLSSRWPRLDITASRYWSHRIRKLFLHISELRHDSRKPIFVCWAN